MTTGNTTLLGLALPVEGELDGTWGTIVNTSITSLLDSAIAGTTTLSADADVTLTTTALAANQARQAVILWTASNGATTRNITAPAQSKSYIIVNAGTGSIVLRGAGPTTGVTIAVGEKCVVAWVSSDFVKVVSSVFPQTLTNPTLISPTITGGTIDGESIGFRDVPVSGSEKTSSYTLTTSDVGKFIQVGSGGAVTIPDATFSAGDAVSIFNNTAGTIVITCTITTAYKAGVNADQSVAILNTRGVCTVLFISGTVCVISGNLA